MTNMNLNQLCLEDTSFYNVLTGESGASILIIILV